jgi:catalase-peroxidase
MVPHPSKFVELEPACYPKCKSLAAQFESGNGDTPLRVVRRCMDNYQPNGANHFHPFGFEWNCQKVPAGAHQWKPKDNGGAGNHPDVNNASNAPNYVNYRFIVFI